MTPNNRAESDSLGSVEISTKCLYGVHTQRAIRNFPLAGGKRLGDYPALVIAMLQVKQACAIVNREIKVLPPEIAQAIFMSAQKLIRDLPCVEFPIAALHGGGGTSANMNVNEVLANMAEESLGGTRGKYQIVHPNDHVNLNQSTNDVYPTACHLAILESMELVRNGQQELDAALSDVIDRWGREPRLARTCLQDAVVIRFGDFFGGYRTGLKRCISRINQSAEALNTVNLGGTICGRSCDVPTAYLESVVPQLATVVGNPALRQSDDLFDAAQNTDDILAVSSALDLLARQMIKICSDLRLLNSGPVGGIKEIDLPAQQAGSSIMPGKVNPVIAEYAMQLCLQVTGLHHACAAALAHAELDLNIWESLITTNVLDMIHMLAAAMSSLANLAIGALRVMPDNIRQHLESPIPVWTEKAKASGYSTAVKMIQSSVTDQFKKNQTDSQKDCS